MLGLGNLLTKSGVIKKFPNDFSFNFDGSNDYLNCGSDSSLDDIWAGGGTLSAWIYPNSDGESNFGMIANKRGGGSVGWIFHLNDESSGSCDLRFYQYRATTAGDWITTSREVTINAWNHIVISFDSDNTSNNPSIYVNGTLVSLTQTGSQSGAIASDASKDLNIGGEAGAYTFDGLIDEVAIWDTALDANTIAKLGSKPVDVTKYSASNLKLWLRAGDKALPESDTAIARQDFYTDFDGTDDYVDCGADVHDFSSGNFTILGWVYHDTGNTDHAGIVGVRDSTNTELQFYINSSNNTLASWNGSGNVYSTSAIADEVWTHVGLVQSSSNKKFYINGVLDNTASQANGTARPATFKIGYTGDGNEYFLGSISNISAYKTELDAQTISQMAKSRFTPMRDNRFSVVDFDGTDDFINTGTGLPDITSGAFTISGWFNFDSVSATHWLWGRGTGSGSGYAIKFDTTPRLIAQSKTASSYQYYASNYTFSVGEWYHITFVHSGTGTTPKIYINGVENAGSGAWNSDIVSQSSLSFKIGSNEGTSNEFDGQIANVAWYSEAKDAEFVYAQYQKGITHNPSADTALEGLWRMGDDTSKAYPTIADSSSNSNDGTITNGASDDIVQQMSAGWDLGSFESSSEELGAERVLEPSFASSTGWATDYFGTGWSITGNKLVSDGSQSAGSNASADIDTSSGFYKVVITVDSISSGTIRPNLENWGSYISTSGTHTQFFTLTGNNDLTIQASADFVGSISFVSTKEVLQSEVSDTYPLLVDVNNPVISQDLQTGTWSQGDMQSDGITWGDYVSANGFRGKNDTIGEGNNDNAYGDEISFTAGKTYKMSFTLTVNSGSIGSIFVGVTSGTDGSADSILPYTLISSTGDYSYNFTPTSTVTRRPSFRFVVNGIYDFTISNFELIEYKGNTGVMTNQDSADLVYSSVLPDQSFLVGNSSSYNIVSLDGSNDYIKNESFTGHQQDTGTISTWVKFGDVSGYQYVVGVGGNTSTGTNRVITLLDENLRFSGYSADFDTGADVSADTWYHIVLIWNGTSVTFYLDGTAYTNTVSNLVTPTGTNFVVGAYPAGFGGKAHADFGTVAHWNKVLTSTEVNAIKDLGRHGNLLDSYSDNLKLCYSMSGLDAKTGFSDTATTIYDRSGNSNHGTTVSIASSDLASSPNAEPNGYAKGDTNRSTTTP